MPTDNETWIIDYGHDIIVKRTVQGIDSLSKKERLVYCLWVADYSMRNGGDLGSAFDLYPDFLSEGFDLSREMNLNESSTLFGKEVRLFLEHYFNLFDKVCNEIKDYP